MKEEIPLEKSKIREQSIMKVKIALRNSDKALSVWAIREITGVHTESIKRILKGIKENVVIIPTSWGNCYSCKRKGN